MCDCNWIKSNVFLYRYRNDDSSTWIDIVSQADGRRSYAMEMKMKKKENIFAESTCTIFFSSRKMIYSHQIDLANDCREIYENTRDSLTSRPASARHCRRHHRNPLQKNAIEIIQCTLYNRCCGVWSELVQSWSVIVIVINKMWSKCWKLNF